MHSFKTFVAALAALAPFASAQIQGHCDPADIEQPNPIYSKYPSANTATLNGTHAIIPIPLSQARAIIPSKYNILTKQIKQWLPKLGANNYPLLVSIEKIHDIYHGSTAAGTGADYSRAHVTFPFVDRLGDGYTAMQYTHAIIVSSSATSVQQSLVNQGYNASLGFFASCNSYEYENATSNLALPPSQRGIDQAAWTATGYDLSNPNIAYRFLPVGSIPYSIDYLYNVTNQPQFSDGTTCNNMIRYYNTDVSLNPYSPIRMYGNVTALQYFFGNSAKTIWTNVYGYKLDVAYQVGNPVTCSTLQGFHVNSAPAKGSSS